MLVNPFAVGGGALAGYPFTAFAAGPVVVTNTLTSTLASLSILGADLTASATYMGVFSLEMLNNTVGGSSGVSTAKILNGATQLCAIADRFQNVSTPQDKSAVCGLFRHQPGASPANVTFDLKVTASQTATGQNGRVTILKLGPNDFSTVDLVGGSGFSSGYATYLTLNFTPAATADYVLLFFCTAVSNSGGSPTKIRFNCAGVTIDWPIVPPAFGAASPIGIMPLSALSGAQTATIQVASDGIGTATVTNLHIFALRRDRFANVHTATLGTDAGTNSTSYGDGLTTSPTVAHANYLTIAGWAQEVSASTESMYGEFVDNGAVIAEAISEPRIAAKPIGFGAHTVGEYSAGARTMAIKRKVETSATALLEPKSAIVSFDLTGI